MRNGPLILSAWPGLATLWQRGKWSGLLVATTFTLLLNLALIATFVRPSFLSRPTLLAVWTAAAAFWLFNIWHGLQTRPDGESQEVDQDLFIRAQGEYLRGNWFEAESALQEIIATNESDVESHLLLATLCRHMGRFDDARKQLTRLERLERAGHWRLEIERERQLLDERKQQSRRGDSTGADRSVA